MIFTGETEELGENLPSATLSTTNPTWKDPGANPGLHGESPATNRLSYSTAIKNHVYINHSLKANYSDVCVYFVVSDQQKNYILFSAPHPYKFINNILFFC
jgi:hypothetical protein